MWKKTFKVYNNVIKKIDNNSNFKKLKDINDFEFTNEYLAENEEYVYLRVSCYNEVIYLDFFDDKKNRNLKNHPTLIILNDEGKKIKEYWYKNEKIHRENGPAIIEYNANGDIVNEKYFINDKEIFSDLQIEIIKAN